MGWGRERAREDEEGRWKKEGLMEKEGDKTRGKEEREREEKSGEKAMRKG